MFFDKFTCPKYYYFAGSSFFTCTILINKSLLSAGKTFCIYYAKQ